MPDKPNTLSVLHRFERHLASAAVVAWLLSGFALYRVETFGVGHGAALAAGLVALCLSVWALMTRGRLMRLETESDEASEE